ncbi:MAG: glycosyl transferase [Hyphomicrobiales bacterium]|nr:MAG: glycosyl transferase [Hyphomicrobiales bacterium]
MALREAHGDASGIPPLHFLTSHDLLRAAPEDAPPARKEVRPVAFDPDGDRRAALVRAWLPILARLGLPRQEGESAAARAVALGTGFAEELIVRGQVGEQALFRAVACELGLPFVETVDDGAFLADEERRLASLRTRRGLRLALVRDARGDTAYLVADPALDLAELRARLERAPDLRRSLRLAPPSALRTAVVARSRSRLLFDAQHGLFLRSPEFSARTVVNAWQGASAAAAVFAFLLLLWLAPLPTMIVFHCLAAMGFTACVALRLAAYRSAAPPRLRRLPPADPSSQPVYSVLVALYREREVLPQLLAALGKLQWPRTRLEIKLVCEADDGETLAALRALPLAPCMEVVLVPPGTPRTKPKALAYALPLCSGEIVTLFDAEDRPHPLQLVEAWQRFCAEGPEVACLQAPLVVTNARASALSLMFSFEYAALFRGLLPWLARHRLVLPLGGTSNHFRRAALEEVGGWDAYNVTEDAELGVRLGRYGYRTGVITRPTYEDAPETLAVWLPQRVRWFKGWMQTWLVHMREPVALWRELGPASFLAMQILSLGMVVSALVHPVFVASVLYAIGKVAWTGALAGGEAAIAVIGLANIVGGYVAFILLGMATLTPGEKTRPLRIVALTPLHWLLLSVAAWTALWEIYRRPHHWSKTPHGRRAARAAA